ncbi:glycoside hydrolase family 172 protein [Gramella sp. AN32]|uniref:Glycoside hydrolase family 172 protein n=1 Tax=Christiangramia antarctica TaxID=2058158 RepID=A0ABW5X6Z9_9FLAO|nr:glycoside hydrolase family 172 protein [Gramella sp. AN32]MCM4155790.1 hypothetical protein [Gramella sp. AN32]
MKLFNKALFLSFYIAMSLTSCNNATEGSKNKKEVITFETLLTELTDRSSLTQNPGGKWKQYQASSYQRLSKTPEDTAGWYANNDWNHFQSIDTINGRVEQVLLDVSGPGVVTRIWSGGNPNRKAILRFYIDGDSIPVWEADQAGALIGENKMIGKPLSSLSVNKENEAAKNPAKLGHNLYAPIPFSKHIKITYQGPVKRPPPGNGLFYNINYRIYEDAKAIAMESMTSQTTTKYKEALNTTNKNLSDFMRLNAAGTKTSKETKVQKEEFYLEPKQSQKLEISGMAAIHRIMLSLNTKNKDQAVKDLSIKLSFDNKVTLDMPVGFFFGSGDQLLPVADWYHKMDSSGTMATFWVMPFKENSVVSISNNGTETISADLEIGYSKTKWTDNTFYFHGKYQSLLGFDTTAKEGKDYNFISLENSGIYVGDILQVTKEVAGWWGEGDEKIYVDNESFPSHFGTGTEDYYGYAWGGQYPDPFATPFVGQPIGEANRKDIDGGRSVNTRVRALDAIPYMTSLRFDMESWNWHGGSVDYEWACFWYSDLN